MWDRGLGNREDTVVSFSNKSNAVKQLLRLLRGHGTPVYEAESVFALYLELECNVQILGTVIPYDLSRPLPHARIARHNLIIVHRRRALRYLRAPERVFGRRGLLLNVRRQPFPWEEAVVAGFLPCYYQHLCDFPLVTGTNM